MANLTQILAVEMNEVIHRANKLHEQLIAQADMRQWPMAGIELGRLERTAEHLASLCRLARDPLWRASEDDREQAMAEAADA